MSILYAPEGQTAPILNLNISPSGVIFARHSELNNFGDNWGLNGGYTYQYSPHLSFSVSDVLGRQGQLPTWAVNSGCFSVAQRPDFSAARWRDSPGTRQSKPFQFHFRGIDLLSFGIISLSGGHIFIDRTSVSRVVIQTISLITLTREGLIYIKPSASEVSITGGKSITSMREFTLTYTTTEITIMSTINNRNNNNVVINFDLGDDYFSNFQINLSPTLTLTASTGISLNAGNNGQPVANNTNITLTKIWETATLSGGVQHGLTSSYGVGGISNTTTVNGQFNYQVTEKLSTIAGVNFSLYDTDDGNFQTFQASAGARYQFTPWLASNLFYAYRWTDSSNSVAQSSSSLLQTGVVRANSVYLTLTANFDLWPNPGLSRSVAPLRPLITTPFPQATTSPP